MKHVLVFRHVPHEGLGTIEPFLNSFPAVIRYCDLFHQDLPPVSLQGIDFVIAMGGPMNADETEKYPFLASERAFIRRAIGEGVPVLGVCLGSQIIARALGARVYRGEKKEIGWYPIKLVQEGKAESVFRTQEVESPVVLQWHGDTFDLPTGAARLASSDLYENQGFQFEQHVTALQFHFEVNRDMVREWTVRNREDVESVKDQTSKEQILKQTEMYEEGLRAFSQKLYPEVFSLLSQESRKTNP
jgi:GMP synthase (glutamine-hydrolysing)